MSVKRTLTKENAAILGVFDHLYALNEALWESFDEEYGTDSPVRTIWRYSR